MNMTATDFIALLPLLIITGTSILIMLAVAIRRRHAVTAALTLAGLAVAFASVWVAATVAPRQVGGIFTVRNRAALCRAGNHGSGAHRLENSLSNHNTTINSRVRPCNDCRSDFTYSLSPVKKAVLKRGFHGKLADKWGFRRRVRVTQT
jgi:hypothetical protein